MAYNIPIYNYGGSRRDAVIGATFDAASKALEMFAQKKRQQEEEDKVLPGLVDYLSKLDEKNQVAYLSRLTAENPGLAAKVSAQLGGVSAPPSTEEQIAELARIQSTGFKPAEQFSGDANMRMMNPNGTPYDPNAAPAAPILGTLGAAPTIGNPLGATVPAPSSTEGPRVVGPKPARFEDSPNVAEHAMQLVARGAVAFGDKFLDAPTVNLAQRAVESPDKQQQALDTFLKIAPSADVSLRDTGANERAAVAAKSSAERNATSEANAKLKADVERERIAQQREKMKAAKDNTRKDLQSTANAIKANNAQINKNSLAFAKTTDPNVKARLTDLNKKLIADNQRLAGVLQQLRSAYWKGSAIVKAVTPPAAEGPTPAAMKVLGKYGVK